MEPDGFYDGCYFFFLCKRHPNNLPHFEDHFHLTLLPATFEVMDDAQQQVLLSTSDPAELTSWLDAHPDSSFDLYLQDSRSQSFMFCHRPGNHHILGIPYEMLNDEKLLFVLKRFAAILGFGCHDAPPPETIEERRQFARAAHSVFRRYHKGQLIPAD